MKLLCFSPNDAVWRWTLPQAQFLEAFKQRNDEVVYVYCDREYSSMCVSMASSGVSFSASPEQKNAICDVCVRQSALVRSEFGFDGRSLRSFIVDGEREEADHIATSSAMEQLVDFRVDGVPIGKFALFETIIQTKSISEKLSSDAERFYRTNFRNTFLTAVAVRRMLSELKPDVGLSYHTAYAYNRTFQSMAEAQGIPVWFLNASLNVAELDSHLLAARSEPEAMFRKLLTDWPRFRHLACEPPQIARAADHLVSLMSGGGFAYSRAMQRVGEPSLRRLGCPPGKKVLLAMLSSYDELLAAEVAGFGWSTRNDVFGSQVEWVRWLFAFARARDDVHVVIRAHPREFPINGKGVRSEHSFLLEEVFAQRPANVSINLPADGIALYDLLVESDVALVAWSSAGMEAGLLGIPVVTYAGDVTLYPRELAFDATSRTQYEAMINEAIDAGWSIERARKFFRWAVLMLSRTRIDLTNGAAVPVRRSKIAALAVRARNKVLATLTPWSREKWALKLRPRVLRDAPRIWDLIDRRLDAFQDQEPEQSGDPGRELAAIRRELDRIERLITRMRGYRSLRLLHLLGERQAINGSFRARIFQRLRKVA